MYLTIFIIITATILISLIILAFLDIRKFYNRYKQVSKKSIKINKKEEEQQTVKYEPSEYIGLSSLPEHLILPRFVLSNSLKHSLAGMYSGYQSSGPLPYKTEYMPYYGNGQKTAMGRKITVAIFRNGKIEKMEIEC